MQGSLVAAGGIFWNVRLSYIRPSLTADELFLRRTGVVGYLLVI